MNNKYRLIAEIKAGLWFSVLTAAMLFTSAKTNNLNTIKKMDYDSWKSHNPNDDYFEGKKCRYCGEEISDLNENGFCDKNCETAYQND